MEKQITELTLRLAAMQANIIALRSVLSHEQEEAVKLHLAQAKERELKNLKVSDSDLLKLVVQLFQ